VTKKPDIVGGPPTSPARHPVLWGVVAGGLLVTMAVAVLTPLEPAQPPAPRAAALPALSTAPARWDPEPTLAATMPDDPAPPATTQAAPIGSPAAVDPQEEQTLYLTIVGDRVYRVMGPVSGRPPRVEEMMTSADGQSRTAAATTGVVADLPGAGFVIADSEPPAPVLGPEERPMGPAPQECPRTLPPGTDQATVDGLRRQSGCRYLSSCTADTNECTFFYQGRG